MSKQQVDYFFLYVLKKKTEIIKDIKFVAIGKSCGLDVDTKNINAGIESIHKITNIFFSTSITKFFIFKFKIIKIMNNKDENCKICEK